MSKNTPLKALPPFHLLIPAAGSGIRMGDKTPKQYMKINDIPILRHTINKFINFNNLKSISVVINKEHHDLYLETTKDLKNINHAFGSNTRKKSVFNGLKSFSNVKNDEIILIHDAARPMVQTNDIEKLLEIMTNNTAATLATPIADTLLKEEKTIDRNGIWAIQTPQAFQYGALMKAHENQQENESFTDDAGLMREAGHQVEIVPSSRQNIKITTMDDYKMVKNMMKNEMEIRTASGFDVHAFEKTPTDRPLMLGGIEIDYPLALTGHSDADVILHAITDAVLGGVNDGDIGTHFPPSDPQWKDAQSEIFLKESYKKLQSQGGELKFIDVTIMAEEPKIKPHHDAIQSKVAEILGIDKKRVSIKATTTEQLGFTGRKEGIACQAIATIALPVTD